MTAEGLPTTGGDARQSYAWQVLRKQRLVMARANAEPCVRCGGEIDYLLSGNAMWGPTVDHLVPIRVGGDGLPPLEALGVAHRSCNLSHGARLGNRLRGARPSVRPFQMAPVPAARPKRPAADWAYLTDTVELDDMPEDAAPPRLFSPPHPDAVGTYATTLIPWIDARLAPSGQALRWWQRLVLARAWEHDADGRLVWRQVVVSTPRQSGKTILTREHALARCANPRVFGEPQVVLHSSRTLNNATMVHGTAWKWAQDAGLAVLRRFGSERIGWPDGSQWQVSSLEAVYGYSASVATVDEAWDVLPKIITAGVLPILTARSNAQLWVLSTANPAATDLVPRMRVAAAQPGSATMLAEWSGPEDADPADMEAYRLASPHWDRNRAELIDSLLGTDDMVSQYLNVWPRDAQGDPNGWPPGWGSCPRVQGEPPTRGIAAVEVDMSRNACGVAVAHLHGAKVRLWSAVVPSLEAALELLKTWEPAVILAGVTIHDAVAREPGPWELRKAGTTETRVATPALLAAVRDGRLSHNHDPGTAVQVLAAVVVPSETGPMLASRRSKGPIPAVKAAAWAMQAAMDQPLIEAPTIW